MKERFKRFLKTNRKKDNTEEEETLFPDPADCEVTPSSPLSEGEPSLFSIFRAHGEESWLKGGKGQLRIFFNLINKERNPEAEKADGVAVVVLKGTTFDDKRENCIDLAQKLREGTASGEIVLVPEPENPYDKNALAAIEKETGKMLGFIPRQADINATYIDAMHQNRLTGAHIIESKLSNCKGKPSAMLLLATGWKDAK